MKTIFSFICIYCLFGGALFFTVALADIFCPIGKEQLFISDAWRKDKENLRWNRKK